MRVRNSEAFFRWNVNQLFSPMLYLMSHIQKKPAYIHLYFWPLYMAIFTFVEGGNNHQFMIGQEFSKYVLYTLLTLIVASVGHRLFMYHYLNLWLYPNWDQGSFWQPYKILQSAKWSFFLQWFSLSASRSCSSGSPLKEERNSLSVICWRLS